MFKKIVTISLMLLICAAMLAQFTPGMRLLDFGNPGTRRVLRTDVGNHYYYRSLPERSMQLGVEGHSSIELRSFSTEPLRRPQVVVIIGRDRKTHDLSRMTQVGDYTVYTPLAIDIPAGTKNIEVLCYDRNTYFRAYYAPAPRRAPARTPNLVVREHAGQVQMRHNGNSSDYYSFSPAQEMKFTVNNSRNADLYVRARLASREPARFAIYHNGELLEEVEFDLRRTGRYTIQGVSILSIGKKISLNQGGGEYILRAVSDNLFFARPVILSNP